MIMYTLYVPTQHKKWNNKRKRKEKKIYWKEVVNKR